MTPKRICLQDPAPPSSGYRFAALAALAETYFPEAARRDGATAPLVTLSGPIHAGEDVHDRQHVTPSGTTTTNGVLWLERAGLSLSFESPEKDRPGEDACLTLGGGADLVAYREAPTTLRASVQWHGDRAFSILFAEQGQAGADFILDRYGRPALQEDRGVGALLQADPQRFDPIDPAPQAPPVRLAIIADAERMRRVYPAVLAAIGDAADFLGCLPEIDVFGHLDMAPQGAAGPDWRRYDGVILPGGADMERTEALIATAAACRKAAVPSLGLCLGMQAMCVAAARQHPELRAATLAEIAPHAEHQVFTPLPSASGQPTGQPGDTPPARLGDRAIAISSDSRLVGRLQDLSIATSWQERMNHRHRLEPRYLDAITESGLRILSRDGRQEIVDIVEDPQQAFFVGSEGHPELNSRRSAPHPLMTAFLSCACRQI